MQKLSLVVVPLIALVSVARADVTPLRRFQSSVTVEAFDWDVDDEAMRSDAALFAPGLRDGVAFRARQAEVCMEDARITPPRRPRALEVTLRFVRSARPRFAVVRSDMTQPAHACVMRALRRVRLSAEPTYTLTVHIRLEQR